MVAYFSDGKQESFDVIIGADGTRSTVRELSGIAYPGIDLEQTWSIADVDADNWRHPGKITLVQVYPGHGRSCRRFLPSTSFTVYTEDILYSLGIKGC